MDRQTTYVVTVDGKFIKEYNPMGSNVFTPHYQQALHWAAEENATFVAMLYPSERGNVYEVTSVMTKLR